jgi:hypothetical protein
MFQFDGVGAMAASTAVKAFAHFPLDDAREFVAEGWSIDEDGHRGMFQKMKDLSHLRLEKLYVAGVVCTVFRKSRYVQDSHQSQIDSPTCV